MFTLFTDDLWSVTVTDGVARTNVRASVGGLTIVGDNPKQMPTTFLHGIVTFRVAQHAGGGWAAIRIYCADQFNGFPAPGSTGEMNCGTLINIAAGQGLTRGFNVWTRDPSGAPVTDPKLPMMPIGRWFMLEVDTSAGAAATTDLFISGTFVGAEAWGQG